MRAFVSLVALMSVLASPVLAQTAQTRVPASADIENSMNEAARSLESLSRVMAVMGPGLSKAMQAASPGLGRAVERAQPSLARAMAAAEPQMAAVGESMRRAAPTTSGNQTPTGADMSRSLQAAASGLEGLSRVMGAMAPDLGKAFDAAAPEVRGAFNQARPALEEAMKAAEPELRRLAPSTGARPLATPAPSEPLVATDVTI